MISAPNTDVFLTFVTWLLSYLISELFGPCCRFQLQLTKEQKLATECDTKMPFSGHKDVLRRLAVFHVFQTRDDTAQQIDNGDFSFTTE